MYEVRNEQFEDLTIHIFPAEESESPRDDEGNLGTLWVPSDDRYVDGDDNAGSEFSFELDDFRNVHELFAAIQRERPGTLVLCVNSLVHSGTSVWASEKPEHSPFDPGGWDSGMCGIVYVTPEKIRAECVHVIKEQRQRPDGTWTNSKLKPVKNITKKLRARLLQQLRDEIYTYNQYLSGDIYGYVIKTSGDEELAASWGIYGFEETLIEARFEAAGLVEERKIEAAMWEQEHRDTMEIEYRLVA